MMHPVCRALQASHCLLAMTAHGSCSAAALNLLCGRGNGSLEAHNEATAVVFGHAQIKVLNS